MSGRTRRSVLAAAGGLAALAGCTTGGTDGGSGSETRLARLRVVNNDDSPHRVDVQIERDGAIANWTSHDLDARSAGEGSVVTVVDSPLESARNVTVEVQLDGDRHRQFAIESGCRVVQIQITGEGALEKLVGEADCAPTGNETA